MSYTVSHGNDTSRKVIDLAIGILVGLRGCSPDDAFAELVRVVHRTGIGVASLAGALVALASGNSESSAEHIEAFNAWGELVGRAPSVPV
jgi:ANTAR domain